MGVLKIIQKGIAFAATAAVSSGLTYWLCADNNERTVAELRERVAELQGKELSAMVTKRVSEQMEDIAFQQKTISDQQRERAEKQSRIADLERGKAELERSFAREAELQAVGSAREADSMRLLAERQTVVATRERQEALAARAKADTLFYNSLGKFLAQNAIAQSHVGADDLASLLSYSSWYYTQNYGGDVYQQDVFTSLLKTAGNSMQQTGSLVGSVRSIVKGDNNDGESGSSFVAVSDYGEIAVLTPLPSKGYDTGKYRTRVIFSDKKCVFRDVQTDGSDACYALDITGKLVRQRISQPQTIMLPLQLPTDKWKHLLRRADGTLVAVGENSVAWVDGNTMAILNIVKVQGGITEAGLLDDKLMLFCNSGRMVGFESYKETSSVPIKMPKGETVTAFTYVKDKDWLVLGTETGPVYIYNRTGKLLNSLHGHTGRVTHMERMAWMLVSSSYDHTVRLWDLRDINSLITSVNITYDRWPLCFAEDEKQRTIRVGLEGGDIRSVNVSVDKNAENTHKSITRDFSADEWRYYIGKDVPYRRFKEGKP